MAAEHITVWIPSSKILNSNNAYKHWANRSGPAKFLRELGQAEAVNLRKFKRAKVDVIVSYPDRRKRDCQNLYPTMKSFVDGLVDNEGNGTQALGKGILPDDNDAYLSGPFLHWSGYLSDRRKEGLFRFDIFIDDLPDVMPKSTEEILEFGQRIVAT